MRGSGGPVAEGRAGPAAGGGVGFGALFGAVMYGAYDHIQGEPRLMVILGCQVKPWGPSILLQDRLTRRWITWRSTRTSRWWFRRPGPLTNPLPRRRPCTTT